MGPGWGVKPVGIRRCPISALRCIISFHLIPAAGAGVASIIMVLRPLFASRGLDALIFCRGLDMHQNKWLSLAGLGLGVFMATLDSSIVNISLPTLAEIFSARFATVQWVMLSYSLVLTSLMLSSARLGDMVDKKRVYMTGLVLFTAGSLLCGLSPSVNALIGFRAVQGLGAVMMQSLGIAMATQIFPPAERGKALGIMGGIVSIGIAVGPALGGLLIGLTGWRSIFWVNLPVGLITFFMVLRFVPALVPAQRGQRFDIPGAVILLVSLGCYALGMTLGQNLGFANPLPLALLAGAMIGLVGLIVVEKRTAQAMIDLSLFRNPLFSLNLLMGFLTFIVMAGSFILPFFLELVKGYPTQQVGLLMMAMPAAMGLTAPASGALSDRFGSRGISMAGLTVVLLGCLTMSTLSQETTPLGLMLRLAPIGMGFGLFQSPNNSAIMGTAPRERLGIASGLLSLSRTLGQSTGLPLMGVIFSAFVAAHETLPAGADITTASPAALTGAIHGTYLVGAGVIGLALLLSVIAYRLSRLREQNAREQNVSLSRG